VSDNLLLDPFRRLLDGLPEREPWPALAESGFLDLLRPEADGGAELDLPALFPFALELGRRALALPILETMVARLAAADALDIEDAEPLLGRPWAAALAAAQMAGAMLEVERLTVECALQRQQFGREIGRFQAVQQQIAVLAEEALAACMAAQAAFTGTVSELSEDRVAVAKIRAGQASVPVCAIAHAVHGAMGISAEHPLHHLTRRLRALRLAHGGDGWWARRLGAKACDGLDDIITLARRI
jgi:acyl-CoA dehydrogenase